MVDSLNKQLIGQMTINNIYIYISVVFWLHDSLWREKKILEAVGQSSDENIQQVFVCFFSFLCFGKLLSSQDDKKAIGKSRFVNSNASQVKIFYK